MQLNGDQFKAEFIEISPFSRIPVLIDKDLRIIESSAILDYLETKYTSPALLPKDAENLAKVRMVQMVTMNELLPGFIGLQIDSKNSLEYDYSQTRVRNVLNFFEKLLADNTYFAGEQLTLAEIVTGNLIPYFPKFDISLAEYPKLNKWSENLLSRKYWQEIELNETEIIDFKRRMKIMPKIIKKRRTARIKKSRGS